MDVVTVSLEHIFSTDVWSREVIQIQHSSFMHLRATVVSRVIFTFRSNLWIAVSCAVCASAVASTEHDRRADGVT